MKNRLVSMLAGLALAMPAASEVVTIFNAPPGGGLGQPSEMTLDPGSPVGTPADLLNSLDNAQGYDADSTVFSQTFTFRVNTAANNIVWRGGGGLDGFMVNLYDLSAGATTNPPIPGGLVAPWYSVIASENFVPKAALKQTPLANGEIQYSYTLPNHGAWPFLANHNYAVSISALTASGYPGWAWERTVCASPPCAGRAVSWIRGRLQSYLWAPAVAFTLNYNTCAKPATAPAANGSGKITAVGNGYVMVGAKKLLTPACTVVFWNGPAYFTVGKTAVWNGYGSGADIVAQQITLR
jgi:hypothetical protein